jgi:hypothetical protein
MKTRSKIGNKKGNPAYRTPSTFRANQYLKIASQKSQNKNPTHIAERDWNGQKEY